MAIHTGHERCGWKGLLVAGACFILPAVLITGVIAWLYQGYGQLPQVRPFIYGIKPAIIAIILAAVFPLAKKALKAAELWVIGVLALVASLAGINEIVVMFGAGVVVLLLYMARRQTMLPLLLLELPFFSEANVRIFLVFLKIGAILYGSGYVLFAFLDSELVAKGLLTRKVLVDAIAVGQFTPGPVFSSVTFIGWQMNGFAGAVMATVAVFLPSFVFVALLNPLVPRMRRSKLFSAFLDGVNAASVAIILTVCIAFARETVTDWRTILIAVSSLAITFGFPRVNTVFVVLGSAVTGVFVDAPVTTECLQYCNIFLVMKLFFCGLLLGFMLPVLCEAQDNYEIQVYASPTVGKDTTMVELHSNYSFIGNGAGDGVVSTNHMDRETIEITHGWTPWFETGFYIFNAFGDMGRTNYVGSHIRPRVMAPTQWNWPVGVSVSFEGGFVKDGYDPDIWTLEIRPIIDKQLGPVYLALNPVVDLTFKGADAGRGAIFAPDFKFSYQIGKVWAPGIEYYGSWGPFQHFDPIAVQQHQLVVSVDADFDPRWEFNAGYVFGLTPSIDRSIFKVIIGRRFGGKKHLTHQTASWQREARSY